MPPKKKDEAPEAAGAAKFGRVRNNLKMGIVGLPNVGKSSLFNLLTDQAIAAENFPFCTIEPNEARCAVPDERYDYLCNLWKPPSEYPAYLHVTDIAGLVRGAAEGAGLGNAFLSNIQAVDGIFHVVRAFESEEVIHVDDSVDPVRDLETIQHELCAKDMEYLKRAVDQEKLDVKKNPTMKLSGLFVETMDKVETMLASDLPIRGGTWSTPEVEMIKEKLPQLITTKPIVYLVNLTKKDFVRKRNKWLVKIHEWIKSHGGGVMIPFSVEFEQELWDLRADEEAQKAFLETAEGAKSALPKMVVQVRRRPDAAAPTKEMRFRRFFLFAQSLTFLAAASCRPPSVRRGRSSVRAASSVPRPLFTSATATVPVSRRKNPPTRGPWVLLHTTREHFLRAPRRRFSFFGLRASELVADERDEKPPTRLIKPLSSFCLSPDIRSRRTRRATRSST
jgi:obg-like ATPase 1